MLRKLCVLVLLLTMVQFSSAQLLDLELLNDMKARSIGPGGMSGRVTSIAVEPGNKDVIFVGTASGGIWKTENGGTNFSPIFDEENVAGIGAIAIDPTNKDVIWVGTGEGNPRNSITGGFGLYKSIDGGRSWALMGLEKTRHIHRIIIHPRNSDVVYIGAIGSPWGPHKERGLYKTSDGGENFEQILFVNEQSGVADMLIDPENPNKLFVAMWEHVRHPWFFNSGGEGSGLHLTLDGGKTWKKLSDKDGLPKGKQGRIGLAISTSNPDIVYALVEAKKNAIYRSDDGGYSWKIRGTENIGNRPFYYAEIYVDPMNENRLYSLYSVVNISEDGGLTFKPLPISNIHSDHHAWWIHPEDPSYIIDGNDGGLAISHDMGKNWRHITNLPVSQFYHIAVDKQLPYNVYGGMQDNGSWKGPAYVWSRRGIINEYWDFLMGGDGFDVQVVPADEKYCYAMAQGGHLNRINTETGKGIGIQPVVPGQKLRFHWNAALATDPFNGNAVYYGSQFLHKSLDRGNSWEVISPDLTSNDSSRQHFDESGGLTYDVTGAETYTCILTIAPSSLNKEVIWVGTDDGKIQLSMNGGDSWMDCSGKIKHYPDRPWVAQIIASKHSDAEAFVVVNNYRQNDYAPYLYWTKDYGKSWERLVDEPDVSGYVLSFVQDPVEPDLMFLGTEYGLYVSLNAGEDWVKWTSGYPTVSTMDMAIQEREADLVIGTFGRSAYVIDDIRPLRAWANQGDAFKDKKIQLFETSTAYMAASKNAPGYYFIGDAYFMGENRRMGAALSFYTKEGKTKEEASFSDSVHLKIFDAEDQLVRQMKFVPERGINKMYWGFDVDGIKLDFGWGRNSRNKYPGAGVALAGDYKLRMLFQGDSSETMLSVKADPRMDYDREAMIATNLYVKEVQEELLAFNTKVVLLKEKKEALDILDKLIAKQGSDSLKKSLDIIKAQFKNFNKELNGPEDVKGIYEDEDLFNSKIRALVYLNWQRDPITENFKLAVEEARTHLKEMEAELDSFLNETWPAFQSEVEKVEIDLF